MKFIDDVQMRYLIKNKTIPIHKLNRYLFVLFNFWTFH